MDPKELEKKIEDGVNNSLEAIKTPVYWAGGIFAAFIAFIFILVALQPEPAPLTPEQLEERALGKFEDLLYGSTDAAIEANVNHGSVATLWISIDSAWDHSDYIRQTGEAAMGMLNELRDNIAPAGHVQTIQLILKTKKTDGSNRRDLTLEYASSTIANIPTEIQLYQTALDLANNVRADSYDGRKMLIDWCKDKTAADYGGQFCLRSR